MDLLPGTIGLPDRVSARSRLSLWHNPASAALALGLAAMLAGCDGSGGGSGGGGEGGSGGGGEGGATTPRTPTIDACPDNQEAHVVSVIVDPTGVRLGVAPASVAGTVAASGIDAPPTPECGSGQAWVKITEGGGGGGGDWIACFQAPGLFWSFTAGEAVTLEYTVDDNGIAPASLHTTLRAGGALVAHVEWAIYESQVALPDGVTVARKDLLCDSPDDPCKTKGYSVTASAGAESADIAPGESGVVQGLRVHVERYFAQSASSACDGGDSDILLSVTPAPRE